MLPAQLVLSASKRGRRSILQTESLVDQGGVGGMGSVTAPRMGEVSDSPEPFVKVLYLAGGRMLVNWYSCAGPPANA